MALLDLALPDGLGLSSFNGLRRIFPDVPVVVLTGLEDKDLACGAVRAGAQDYLVKGELTAALLSRTLTYAVDRHETQRAELTRHLPAESALVSAAAD